MAAPQPLHILQKDLRHLLPETLVSLFFFALFAFTASYDRTQSDIGPYLPLVKYLLYVLMPITWMVVISRLIQDEPLVGDRQFWTSRPYHWASLLAAKFLYLILFLYLPFLLMQVFLLLHAGLYPTTALGPLFHNLLLLSVFIVVPIAVISAVTSSFVWVLLAMLGGIVYCSILWVVVFLLKLRYLTPPTLQPFLYAVMLLLPLAVMVFQYARRRTVTARLLLLATPLLVALIVLAFPASALVKQAYPIPAADAKDLPKLDALPDQFRPKQPEPGNLEVVRGNVEVVVPFTVAKIDRESNYVVDGASITIDAPGLHWVSPYDAGHILNQPPQQLNSGSPFGFVRASVPVDIFDKLRNIPADVHVSLATDHFKADKPETWKASGDRFSVPGNGVCTFDKVSSANPPICRYPFKSPELNVVTANVTQGPCGAGVPSTPARMRVEGVPAGLGFDPVVSVDLNFPAPQQQQNAPPRPQTLCPGTPLEFVEAKSVGRVRFEIDEKGLLLNNFAARQAPPAGQATPAQPEPTPR
jgi:hypothetical protein